MLYQILHGFTNKIGELSITSLNSHDLSSSQTFITCIHFHPSDGAFICLFSHWLNPILQAVNIEGQTHLVICCAVV